MANGGMTPDTSCREKTLSGAELVNPYGDVEEESKSEQVERMFDSIAPAYDFMNAAMTLGLCDRWRNRALNLVEDVLRKAGREMPGNILDVACGTGDVAFEMARRWPDAQISGIDLSEGMLAKAREKQAKLPSSMAERICFSQADCLSLPFPDASFDLVTVAYGVRNFERLAEGYSEMFRVLKPKGLLCVIELSRPDGRLTGPLYDLYSRTLIPLAGRLVSGDPRAYSYLPESIAAAPQRDDMTHIMANSGFTACIWKSLTFGAVTIYLGVRPGPTTKIAPGDTTN